MPGLADLPAGSTVNLSFKSYWDIEWDYDYGFVLTTTDSGQTYTSHASENGYTTSNTDPLAGNANQNGCQTTYDNGITGTSGSYAAGTEATDRKTGTTPAPVFLEDSYDISDLAGEANGALRFSYATDPGLARPGWFIDDVKVTATTPVRRRRSCWTPTSRPAVARPTRNVFNGGCQEDLSTAQQCTLGWKYLQAGADSVQDHAYYLEMRDRSGFDLDGNGQADRGAADFQAGFYLSYTDEAHGYGNAGTDDPPAQSPLDSVPVPGQRDPEPERRGLHRPLAAGRRTPIGPGHRTSTSGPQQRLGNWEFAYDGLDFT